MPRSPIERLAIETLAFLSLVAFAVTVLRLDAFFHRLTGA